MYAISAVKYDVSLIDFFGARTKFLLCTVPVTQETWQVVFDDIFEQISMVSRQMESLNFKEKRRKA